MQTQDSSDVRGTISELDFGAALEDSRAKVFGWIEGFITHLPNLVAALIVLAIFMVLARVVRGAAARVLRRFSSHPDVNHLIESVAFVIVLFAGLFFALDVMDLDRTVTSLLAGAGIIGLALGFAFQDTAENFISGVFLAVRKQYTHGDIIETNDVRGVVQDMTLRTTILRAFDGRLVVIPNNKVYKNVLTNFTASGMRRVELEVGVSYGTDLARAQEVVAAALESVEGRVEERPVEVFYTEFDDSAINFEARFWIPFSAQVQYMRARSDAIMRIKAAFDDTGITIPFPIRTLDFSEVGGETIARAWPAGRGSE